VSYYGKLCIYSGIVLQFKLSDMGAIGPLTMAQDNVLRVQMNQNLLAADLGDIGELWDFQIACIREMSLINGGHVTLSGNVTLRIVTIMLGILEGKIRSVVLGHQFSNQRALLERNSRCLVEMHFVDSYPVVDLLKESSSSFCRRTQPTI